MPYMCSHSSWLLWCLACDCRYHSLYVQAKGARYKTKRVLMETIHKIKSEASRVKVISDQATVAKLKAGAKKQKKESAAEFKKQA
jgi:large subunit ribosomal protein L19e